MPLDRRAARPVRPGLLFFLFPFFCSFTLVISFAACGSVSNAEPDALAGVDAPRDAPRTADAPGSADAAPPKHVFVTSATFTGALGGAQGADDKCAAAAAGHLPGSYKAWISSATESASARLSHSTGPYVLADDTTVVAASWTDLVDGGPLNAAINLTELQEPAPINATDPSCTGAPVWTGTFASGMVASGFTCGDWSATMGIQGMLGRYDRANEWTYSCTISDCTTSGSLYCFEQ